MDKVQKHNSFNNRISVALSPGEKRLDREADHSPSLNAEDNA
jgi:hypothetical protein